MGSVWWFVARASGIVAWGLASLAVIWGLLLSSKVLGRRVRPNWLLDLHRFLGGLTVVFVAVHLVGLFLDPFVKFDALELVVPFASHWKPLAVAWGIVAIYLLIAIEITSLARSRLPKSWWKGIHMSSYALFVVATIHLLTAGTDRNSPILLWSVGTTALVVAVLTIVNFARPRRTGHVDGDTIRTAQPIG